MEQKISQTGNLREGARQILDGSLEILNTNCVHEIKHQRIHSLLEQEQSLNLVKMSARTYLLCLRYYEQLRGIVSLEDIYHKQKAEEILGY